MKTRRQGENQDMRKWGGGGIGSPERQYPNAKHEQEITLQFAEHDIRGRKVQPSSSCVPMAWVLLTPFRPMARKREWPQSSVANSRVKAAVTSCPSVCLGNKQPSERETLKPKISSAWQLLNVAAKNQEVLLNTLWIRGCGGSSTCSSTAWVTKSRNKDIYKVRHISTNAVGFLKNPLLHLWLAMYLWLPMYLKQRWLRGHFE